jgi:hypothetical protein
MTALISGGLGENASRSTVNVTMRAICPAADTESNASAAWHW